MKIWSFFHLLFGSSIYLKIYAIIVVEKITLNDKTSEIMKDHNKQLYVSIITQIIIYIGSIQSIVLLYFINIDLLYIIFENMPLPSH